MEVTVLAVTKAFGRYCIAGMKNDGTWIRPIPQPYVIPHDEDRFWTKEQLTFDNEFIQVGDKIAIEGYAPKHLRYPNHSEDFITTRIKKVGHLTVEELMVFLDRYAEDYIDFKNTVNGNSGRSLCLLEVDSFYHRMTQFDGKTRITMGFNHELYDLDNPRTNAGDFIVKDCRWEYLILKNAVPDIQHNKLFLCIGLATPFKGVDFPMVIGLMPDYEVPVAINN